MHALCSLDHFRARNDNHRDRTGEPVRVRIRVRKL